MYFNETTFLKYWEEEHNIIIPFIDKFFFVNAHLFIIKQ